ncbi:ubiquinone biosynthesis protein COQ7-domain-containing protein [Massariosphaeria phaeospora]|uniref:5-demethoxyubiquinone hydroxylase, mitochondrial n=1 Tax=Massariosphaeria phaeospora TaxID=100035 RepID=A0A7C8MDQ3_9PLEO|nr:ubiquinone biosynthesis protein COQ7-domain-containing protein [Massariosphaeria phaeospora]
MATARIATRSLARASSRHAAHPVLDFLAPTTAAHASCQIKSRSTHSAASPAPIAPQHSPPPEPFRHHKISHTLTDEQSDFLDSALRVNQAGELAAVLIYTAQTPPLVRSHPHLRPLMKHMHDQEDGHFRYFNELIAKHRIRPTALYPVWYAAATALGWGTAVMGREAAMACTEAVETEIGGHYNEQVRVLLDWAEKLEGKGELGEELDTLIQQLRRIRDEELEHLDHAVENDSKQAKPYELLTNVIRGGCRAAIRISEKL